MNSSRRKQKGAILFLGGLFYVSFGTSLPPVMGAATNGLAGFDIQSPQIAQSKDWLKLVEPLLEEHAQATGQIIRVQIRQGIRPDQNSALQSLVSLPVSNSDRKNTCVIQQEVKAAGTRTITTGPIEIECGLGLSQVLESRTVTKILESLRDESLQFREWEARFVWLTLELLQLLESPINDRLQQLGMRDDLSGMERFILRWREFHAASASHGVESGFDPDAVLDDEGLYPTGSKGSLGDRTARTLPDLATALLLGTFLLTLASATRIARKPAFRATSAGLFRLKLSDRLRDRVLELLNKTLMKRARHGDSETLTLRG